MICNSLYLLCVFLSIMFEAMSIGFNYNARYMRSLYVLYGHCSEERVTLFIDPRKDMCVFYKLL